MHLFVPADTESVGKQAPLSTAAHRVRLAMDHVHDHVWVVLALCLITVAFFGFILWHQQTVVLPERNKQLRAERAKNRIEKLA
jgi:hypothetical protein